MIKYYN